MIAGLSNNPWVAGYLDAWRRYADFSGRSSLGEYLHFFVPNLLIGFLLQFLGQIDNSGFLTVMGIFYGLAALIPGVAITVRLIRQLVVPT